MRLIDADRLLDRCIFYHLPNGDLAVPIIDVQHAPTVEASDINVGNMDVISRQAAIDKITKRLFETAFNNVGIKQNIDETLIDVAENRLENWLNELPSVQLGTNLAEVGTDLIRRQATYLALVEKGQASKRYKLGETWELNGEEIREVLDALPSAQPELDIGNDGTLYISVSKGQLDKINRVLVEEDGSIFCKQFY